MADTIIQRLPTSDFSVTGWYKQPMSATYHYQNVDDTIGASDDASTYNYPSSSGTQTQLFGYTAFDVPANARNIILKIIVRANRSGDTQDTQINGAIRISGTTYTKTAASVTTTFTDYTFTYSVDPSTTSAWTPTGVNAVEYIGFQGQRVGFSPVVVNNITQVYAEVSYNLKAPYACAGPGIVVGAESVSAG